MNTFHKRSFIKCTQVTLRRFEHGQKVVDTAGDRKGLALVNFRAGQIVKNVRQILLTSQYNQVNSQNIQTADGQSVKILHLLSGGDFYKSLGYKATNFDMDACTDYIDDYNSCMKLKQYSTVKLIDVTDDLPYPSGVYHYAICLYPIKRLPEQPRISVKEVSRVLNDRGIFLIGFRDDQWNYEAAQHELAALENSTGLTLLVMQCIQLTPEDIQNNVFNEEISCIDPMYIQQLEQELMEKEMNESRTTTNNNNSTNMIENDLFSSSMLLRPIRKSNKIPKYMLKKTESKTVSADSDSTYTPSISSSTPISSTSSTPKTVNTSNNHTSTTTTATATNNSNTSSTSPHYPDDTITLAPEGQINLRSVSNTDGNTVNSNTPPVFYWMALLRKDFNSRGLNTSCQDNNDH